MFPRTGLTTLSRVCDIVPGASCSLTAPSRRRQAAVSSSSRAGHGHMPKKAQTVTGPAAGGGAARTEACAPVCRDRGGCVTIAVHAKPGSKRSSVTDVSAEAVGVAIAAPPADGEANTELIRYLAEVLGLKRSLLCLHKGSRSRDKVIRVDSSLSPEEVLRRLRQAAG